MAQADAALAGHRAALAVVGREGLDLGGGVVEPGPQRQVAEHQTDRILAIGALAQIEPAVQTRCVQRSADCRLTRHLARQTAVAAQEEVPDRLDLPIDRHPARHFARTGDGQAQRRGRGLDRQDDVSRGLNRAFIDRRRLDAQPVARQGRVHASVDGQAARRVDAAHVLKGDIGRA